MPPSGLIDSHLTLRILSFSVVALTTVPTGAGHVPGDLAFQTQPPATSPHTRTAHDVSYDASNMYADKEPPQSQLRPSSKTCLNRCAFPIESFNRSPSRGTPVTA